MKTLHKIRQLLINGPRYGIVVFAKLLYSYIQGTKATPIKTYLPAELASKLQAGTSLIRLGDGEAMLMTGRDIHYQITSPALCTDLRLILEKQNPPYILALPSEALTASDAVLRQRNRFRIWRLFRCFAQVRLSTTETYADAHSFYRQEYLQVLLPTILKNKQVICVSRKDTLDSILKNYLEKFATSVTFIESPSRDSYESIDSLANKINSTLTDYKQAPLLLLAAGPASKVLAYRFSEKGIQSIDIGHGLEIVGRDLDYSDKI